MFNRILILLLTTLVAVLPIATAANASDTPSPEQVVAEFQKVPHYEMFCKDENWKGAVPSKVDEKFKTYFSKEFYKLFMWTECGQPTTPPSYNDMSSSFSYDIRFSISYGNLYLEETESIYATDIRIRRIKNKNDVNKATVGVNFNYGTKMFTTYILIREDGQWKIDDIAPQANYIKNPKNEKEDWANEGALDHSDSIKADMQGFYRAAEKRYQEEQAKKH